MAWGTPTEVSVRGRHIRHTLVTIVGTQNGTVGITSPAFTVAPLAIYAGMVQVRSDGGTATDVSRLIIQTSTTTVSNSTQSSIYDESLTLGSDPDWFPIKSLFELITQGAANLIGDMTLPTNEFELFANSDNAAQTSETLTVYIALLSHVLEV